MNHLADVLVIDDEPVVCDAIRIVLAEEGLRVASVASAEEALNHPALSGVRLVICDLMLPGRSGLETLRALRAARPDLPVVMISGYATTANVDRMKEAGATAFLAKPFDVSELWTQVRRALAESPGAGKEVTP